MKIVIIISVIGLLFLAGLIYCFIFIIKSFNTIDAELLSIKQKALDANTIAEIKTINDELEKLAPKLWHKSFTTDFVEIKTILMVKFSFFKKDN